jgi:hypothetical protein
MTPGLSLLWQVQETFGSVDTARRSRRTPRGQSNCSLMCVRFRTFRANASSITSLPFSSIKLVHCVTEHGCHHVNSCKIWGSHGRDYEECGLLGYKTPVRTSQKTHYVSATEPSQLMLCKIWGFHGSDYEECRLLGYKTLVRTSQEIHYVSTTESSQLMLCKIWGFLRRWLWRMSSAGI